MLEIDQLRQKAAEVSALFPWYNALLGEKNPHDISDLQDLPLLTSGVLEKHYYHHHWDDQQDLSVYHTSGTSSGKRKAIAYSAEDEAHYAAIKARLFAQLLEGGNCTRALADMGTGHAAGTALDIFKKMGLDGRAISFTLPIAQHIEALQSFKPDLLYTMPSILERLVAASDDPRAFGIRKIILVGEIASIEWQRSMAERFGLKPRDIVDTYGSIEIGTIAYFDHDAGRYFFVENLYAEGVHPGEIYPKHTGPFPQDEHILVLTSFARQMLPALRFVTNDVVRDFRPVRHRGKTVQSFQCIVKRMGNEMKHGEKISLYDIEESVHKHINDALIRVETAGNKLTVRIKSKTATAQSLARVQTELGARIPEIGMMIRGGLLEQIDVVAAEESEIWTYKGIKQKRIYVEDEG